MSSVTISFCLDDERDRDLLDWLGSHTGSRSAIIRDTLRQGLGQAEVITLEGIGRTLQAELARYVWATLDPGVSTVSPEPERPRANLDGLEGRLEDWE